MAALQLVSMHVEHLPAIARLEQLCFQSPWSEQALCAELTNPRALFFTALSAGKVAGYVGSHRVLDECTITNVAVDPAYRRQGVGQALLLKLAETGKQLQLAFLTLEVRVSNIAAISLYQKMGFETVGRRKNAYDLPREDGFVMTLFL